MSELARKAFFDEDGDNLGVAVFSAPHNDPFGTYEYSCQKSANWSPIELMDNRFPYWDPRVALQRVQKALAGFPPDIQQLVKRNGRISIPNPVDGVLEAEDILPFLGLNANRSLEVESPLLLGPECSIR